MANVRVRPWHYSVAALVIAVIVLVSVWNWDWFISPIERLASAKLGRAVTLEHLHVRIARNPVLEADGVTVANPPGFPDAGLPDAGLPNAGPPNAGRFAQIARLAVTVNGPAWLHGQPLVVPAIEVDHPEVNATALPDGRNNWTFPFSGAAGGGKAGSGPRIGDLRITGGSLHAVDPRLRADFRLEFSTQAAADHPAQLVVHGHGTYAGQPITGQFTGGALLTLRDKTTPYPVDLALANGATHVTVRGTVEDPLALAGMRLKVELSGTSLADLMPLSGVPAPPTPPFHLSGDLTYANKRIRLDNLVGGVGKSDIEGSMSMDPGPDRPQIDADLRSHRIDLTDFGGVIGATPGTVTTPGQTPQQRAALAKAEASPTLIPHTPIDLPRLEAADVTLHYHGEQIQGRFVPLDNVAVEATIKNGAVRLHPVSFGVGRGRIVAEVAADRAGSHALQMRADVDFREVDLARLMAATHAFGGAGTIGGRAVLEGTGSSAATILGDGNGDLKLFMTGGDLSALLVDLSGFEFGNALLSALGMPKKTAIHCLVADFALQHGVLDTRTMLLDTGEANVTGKGTVNLRTEAIDYQLRTEAKHFSIGSLPAPIDITGHLKSPSVAPDAKELAVRGGLAAGLGVLLTPLAALLPTIQLGLGANNDCAALIHDARNTPDPARKPGETH